MYFCTIFFDFFRKYHLQIIFDYNEIYLTCCIILLTFDSTTNLKPSYAKRYFN